MVNLLFFLRIIILMAGAGFQTGSMKHSEPNDCKSCHKSITGQAVIHAVADSCLKCHIPDGNPHPGGNNGGFIPITNVSLLCFSCHSDIGDSVSKLHFVHNPAKENRSCLNCHSPHGSSQPKLLIKEEKELCISCHDHPKGANTEADIKYILENDKHIHPAIKAGCAICHSSHASSRKFLLTDNFPAADYLSANKDSFTLCFNCHDPDLYTAASTTTATAFRNGDKNLHYSHMNGKYSRSCILCHEVHGSENDHLIRNFISYGKWNMPVKYMAADSGGSCAPGCHSLKAYKR